jgi:hypothetical protein
MTEGDWVACVDPWRMLDLLQGKASDRKYRLFAVACCRRIAHLLVDERSRAALEICEQFADGFASMEAMLAASSAASAVYDEANDDSEGAESAALAVAGACWTRPEKMESSLIDVVDNAIGVAPHFVPWKNAKEIERRRICRLFRDIFGYPFCPADIRPHWLVWNDRTIPKLAEASYEHRTMPEGTLHNAELGLLADALEDVGADQALFEHLRQVGPHFRGCHVLDAILGKQ